MLANRTWWKALLCTFVLVACPLVYGQATGSFFGTVADTTGSVIAGAKITATAQETGVSRDATTDQTGHYLIPLLAVGNYTVKVSMANFQTVTQTNLRLQVDEHRELDFTLPPAAVTQTVEVSATPVAVQTADPTLGQVITSQQVAQLPLNGRDFVQLATLTPGTTQETNPSSFFNGGPSSEVSARGTYSLSVGGSRAQSTDWLLDGNDNNELTAGGISILPSIDAIQEFKVLTFNYSAEYGTRAGPTVLVTTKAGTNNFHGSVFEFFRNTKLDARSFFAAEKEKFNLNQFGGALGGPIQKDKTFFFADYQGKRQRHGIPFLGTIPTPDMKNGDFRLDPFIAGGLLTNPYAQTGEPANFQCVPGTENLTAPVSEPINSHGGQAVGTPCNVIPAGLIDPVGQRMLNLYPTGAPTYSALGTNFANVPVRRLDENEFDVRVDHSFSPRDSVFARFSYDQATSFVPGGSPGFAEASAFASTQNITNHGRNVAVSETHVFSERTVNQFNAGFNRIFNHILSFGDKSCESAKLGIQGANLDASCAGAPPGLSQSGKDCMSCGLSSTLMGNYWALGDRGFAPFQGGTNVFSISDSFDMIRGRHDIKVGGQIRAQQMNVETNAFQDGFLIPFGVSGDTAADILMGQVGLGIHDQTFLGAVTGRRWKMFRPFVQDDWRMTKDLTVNIGLAWAFVTPITEAHNRQANFDFATGRLLVTGPLASQAGCTICLPSDSAVGIQFDKTAVEPRIGFAWKPMGSQNTAIRGGYAIFHDSSWNQGAQGLWENPPYLAESDNFNNFSVCPLGNTTINCGLARVFLQPNLQPITSPPNPSSFPGTVQAQNLNFKQGMIQQFNANFERQLPGNAVVTVGYAGSRSSHILVDGLNLNVASPSACGKVVGYTLGCGIAATPYPNFGVISNNNDVGRAKYDSLQVKLETKSSRHGLYALLGYTYARTYDSGFPDGLGTPPGATYWPLPNTQKLDWGLSQINLNHQFTASVLYNLPFGKGKHFGANWNGAANTILGGWEIDAIEKATSGFPLFVVNSNNSPFTGSGVNFQWNGNSLNRPNMVGDPNQPGPVAANPTCQAPTQIHTLTAWFNPCAFMVAPDGELGNAPRSPVSGPRFVNTDLSFIKHFPLWEKMQLDFRAEFFNLLNHPQFFLSGGGSGMQDINQLASFAVVNETVNNPRVIQFALKLQF
ncbi:MAG TPA: carboxypeptidase-like regulatory domain-containing protein [Terriglobales bacterium]|nr:carboxypeptidase-like regulatory domain-containing protein [Terriglobales bacterium]